MPVLSIGRPTEGGTPRRTRARDDQMVVSVGPYRFQTSGARVARASASSAASVSPPVHARNGGLLPSHPASTSRRQVAGVACMTVAPLAAANVNNCAPSRRNSCGVMMVRPPTTSGRNSSSIAMSKPMVVTASMASSGEKPGVRRNEFRTLTRARWLTTTPFGVPVDPDV